MITDLANILRAGGVNVREEAGWQGRGRPGTFGPIVGVLNHHTATSPATNGVVLCINGRPDLSGPLCHIVLSRDGTAHVIAAGRANHAGLGSSLVLAAVKASMPPPPPGPDNSDGNAALIGIEVENTGTGEPYPAVQLASLFKINAALCKHYGWNENHCIHHREFTKRKIDMSWHGDLRGEVRKLLSAPIPPAPPQQPPTTIGDDMATIKQVYVSVLTDASGNGYAHFMKNKPGYYANTPEIPFDKVRAVFPNGSYVPSGDPYGPIPRLAIVNWDSHLFVEVNGGSTPHQGIYVQYAV